ncbi:sterol desaturase family protein [Neobacillus sp. WH10]|uniref:sterol desaturase family protein n=1 Tax=Neobacillus sp. WH10 TaxID=3047873 RepID=UPI0024C1F0C3|nr:sterol desaturase family protein [Neobacillus sp. WH10]WHY79069.1 sterol desaturase family protein [Neobacillus sp. WH10]
MKVKYLKQFLSFPDIFVMSLIFLICFGFMFSHLSSLGTWVSFVLGMAGYIISEYMTHRFLFHMKPPKNAFFLKLLKRIHYDHHSDPNNLHLLFLPLWYSLPNIIVVGGIVYFITASLIITNAFITGVILFLLYYEWVHYRAHRPFQPLSPWGRWMKKIHLWHHFKNENFWYGVTNPSMDIIMGTFKDQKEVKLSKTTKNLEKRCDQDFHL